MKRFVYLFLLLSLSVSAFAVEITKENARSLALNAITSRNPSFSVYDAIVTDSINNNQVSFYIVQFKPQGWALISKTNQSEALLGYSADGVFEKNAQPESMRFWLNRYDEQIKNIIQNPSTAASQVKQKASAVVNAAVSPLIKVNWNQTKPYNQFCPSDANGQAIVGCVAVSMAQAMTVARFPDRPVGYFSYFSNTYGNIYIDYDKESAYDWDVIISGSDSKVSAARLLFQCGVSVKMDYSTTASGTQTSYIPGALKTYFSYPSSVTYYSRDSYDGDWSKLVIDELNSGRAVVYSGQDVVRNEGHAFNLDGFDGTSMFHVNWGWGGQNNGYYTIDGLKDSGFDFTAQQGVVVGIRAPSVAPSDITLSSSSVPEQSAVGTVVGAVSVQSEAVNPTYTFELKGPYSILTHGYLPAAFYIEDGNLKTKDVFSLDDGDQSVYIKATNTSNGLFFEKEFDIAVTKSTSAVNYVSSDSNKVFSNDNKSISIQSDEAGEYKLYSISGALISAGNIDGSVTTVSLKEKGGCYIVQIIHRNSIKNYKVLLR